MRIRAPLLLSTLLLGALAGCSSTADPALLEGSIVRPGNFKAGSGVIASVGVLRGAGSGNEPHRYRLYLMMDAGGFQSVDIDSSRFLAGEAVELTNDGRVVRVSGTSFTPRQ